MSRITQVRGKRYITLSDSDPTRLEVTPEEVSRYIFNKLGKKGLTTSRICLFCRDSSGIDQVRFVSANNILLKELMGFPPAQPYLYDSMRMATQIHELLPLIRNDEYVSRFMLIMVEPSVAPPHAMRLIFYPAKRLLQLMKTMNLAPDLPEDLYSLINKAVLISKHLETNRHDEGSKLWLLLVESRIHRLARYYKTYIKTLVSPSWKYLRI